MRNGLFYNFLWKEMMTGVLHVCVCSTSRRCTSSYSAGSWTLAVRSDGVVRATSEAKKTPRRGLFATLVGRQRENSYLGFSFLSNSIPAYILENIFKTTLMKTSCRHP